MTNLYSIGHSTWGAEEFLRRLRLHEIDILADVRSHPVSRWSQFNQSNLKKLPVPYVWLPNLGGWSASTRRYTPQMEEHGVAVAEYTGDHFPKDRISKRRPGSVTGEWTNQGLYDYAWFTTTTEFQQGLRELLGLAKAARVAYMCAEVLWWKCHRSMIADVLWHVSEVDTLHAIGAKATLHSHAIGDRIVRYPLEVRNSWL